MDTTPPSLLERLRQSSDERSWRQFVDLYTPLLFFWARRLGLQESDAADLVQEMFALLVQRLPEFCYDRHRSFRNWLRTLLRNKWRELQRRRAVRQTASAASLDDLADADHLAERAEEEFRQHLAVRALQMMQAEFQDSTWKACWETIVCGRDTAEVAKELGLSVNALYLARARVLCRLRQNFQDLVD